MSSHICLNQAEFEEPRVAYSPLFVINLFRTLSIGLSQVQRRSENIWFALNICLMSPQGGSAPKKLICLISPNYVEAQED